MSTEEQDIIYDSKTYQREATSLLIYKIIKLVFFGAAGYLLYRIYDRNSLSPIVVPYMLAVLIFLHIVGPLFRFGMKYVKREYNTRTWQVEYERSMGREGIIAAFVIMAAYFIFHLWLMEKPKYAPIIVYVGIIAIIFLILIPVIGCIFEIITAIRTIHSAKVNFTTQPDKITDDVFVRGYTAKYIVNTALIVLFVTGIIVSVILGIFVGKTADKSVDLLDTTECILQSDIEELPKKELATASHGGNFSFDYSRYEYHATVNEIQRELCVPMNYYLIFKFNKDSEQWEIIKYTKEPAFVISDDKEMKQAGFFNGKGKLVSGEKKAEIELTFSQYTDEMAMGTLSLTYKDGTVVDTFFEGDGTYTFEKKWYGYQSICEYNVKMETPISDDENIELIYDTFKDKVKINYMGETVTLKRFTPQD